MQLNGLNLVDTASVIPYYTRKGLSLELIRQCNSQEFRFIDGYGRGHFLMTQTVTDEKVTLVVDSRTVELKIIDVLSLEHPNHSGGLKVYVTAEPKYELIDVIVQRNYNITIDKSLPPFGVPTIVTLKPDLTPKNLEQVIEDILPDDYTLDYNADAIVPYDISIEGLSVLRAIDHLCSIYGLIWTFDGDIVHVWDMQPPDGPSDAVAVALLQDPINDIHHTKLQNSPTNINVAFPIYNYARQVPREYYTYENDDTGQGQTVNVMDPYTPAIVGTIGDIRNQTALDAMGLIIAENLKGIKNSLEYVVKEFFEAAPLNVQPICLSEIYGDFGSGPRSIYRAIHYPVMLAKTPECKSRFANNWIGELTDGYVEGAPHFTVTPLVGLDGKRPTGDQKVYNIYNWTYGEPGWKIRVEWSPFTATWYPIQQEFECPPDNLETEPVEQSPTEDPWNQE